MEHAVHDELIQASLRYIAQRASMFLLTPSQLSIMVSHLDKLKLCLSRLCPPYVPQGLNDFQIPGTLTYTTFYQICWPMRLLPPTTVNSGPENTQRAIVAHAFSIRFVIHPVSDIDGVLESLRRQTSHLQLEVAGHNPEKQVWPSEVRMRDFKLLLNAEIPWLRMAFTVKCSKTSGPLTRTLIPDQDMFLSFLWESLGRVFRVEGSSLHWSCSIGCMATSYSHCGLTTSYRHFGLATLLRREHTKACSS